jgi:phosphoadenosine phosphosulfate reductase
MAPKPGQPDAATRAAALNERFGTAEPQAIIAATIEAFGEGEVAAVSSFGADSAVLLHMISAIDRNLPVVFLDTGKHFEETLRYRDDLIADLGLTNLVIVSPEEAALTSADPRGDLHINDVEACCAIRKVEPMARGVAPYRAWFTGRKRFQAGTRAAMPVFETVEPRVRVNPLAGLNGHMLAAYMEQHELRPNPLVAFGYFSIGCFPCTQPTRAGEDPRSGRWAGQAKTECGIHLGGLNRSLATKDLQETTR